MHSAAFTAGVDLHSQQCLRHHRFATGVVTADLQAFWSCAAAGEMREKGAQDAHQPGGRLKVMISCVASPNAM